MNEIQSVNEYKFEEGNFFMIMMRTKEGAQLILLGRETKESGVALDNIESSLPGIDLTNLKFEYNKRVYKLPEDFCYIVPKQQVDNWLFTIHSKVIPVSNLELLEWRYEHPNR